MDEKFVLADRLKALVQEKGLSFKTLSRDSGVPLKTLYGWTAGNRPRNLQDLRKVARCLGVSIHELSFEAEGGDPLHAPSEASSWISASRERTKMSPVDAAAVVGIPVSLLLQYEAGKDVPLMQLIRILAAYKENEAEVTARFQSIYRKLKDEGSAAF